MPDDDREDLPIILDDDGTDLEPLPELSTDEAVSIPEDGVSLAIGDLPDLLSGEAVSLVPVDDTAATLLDLFESNANETSPPVVLPWRTTARLPALSRQIPCTCDTAAATSRLVLREGSDTPTLELQLIVGALNATVVLLVEAGDVEHVTLGRDLLAGRVWVDCSAQDA